jgi:hypothetical protein
MSTIELRPLLPSDAESFFAQLWLVLERDGLASPRVTIETLNDGFLQISLAFVTVADAAAVSEKLAQVSMRCAA